MSLVAAIRAAFPSIIIGPGCEGNEECVVSGGVIIYWNRAEPKPDEAALIAAYDALPDVKIARIAANRAEARRRIEAKYPLWRQQSAVLGVYPESYTAQMAADIAAVVAAENTAADLIDAATTEAEVAAVTVNWPSI